MLKKFSLELVDFTDVLNRLKSAEILPSGRIRSYIDDALVSQGFYDEKFSFRPQHINPFRPDPRDIFIRQVFRFLEDLEVLKFNHTKKEGPQHWKIKYYSIHDDRVEWEYLQDLLPDLTKDQVFLLLRMRSATISDLAKYYKMFINSLTSKST